MKRVIFSVVLLSPFAALAANSDTSVIENYNVRPVAEVTSTYAPSTLPPQQSYYPAPVVQPQQQRQQPSADTASDNGGVKPVQLQLLDF